MLVYKAFEPGLICRGYKFKEGVPNTTKEANCSSNGFHAAEHPLDCLSYYDWDKGVFYACNAAGDIDEDHIDSKISCTVLTPLYQLSLTHFLLRAITYIVSHPLRENTHVHRDRADITKGFAVVRGKDPIVRGELGCYFALARERATAEHIKDVALFKIDGKEYKPGVWYGVDGEVSRDEDKP